MAPSILNQQTGDNWTAINGDCVEFVSTLPDNSVNFSVYSPPFGDLFVYSDSVADMGNCVTPEQFFEQYSFLARELLRIVKPGRLIAVHCSDLPLRKWIAGEVSMSPFSDQLSQAHRDAGWLLHCRITVWRDPVVEMQRTKALGLLYKQLCKDSSMSRTGMPDYVLVFRKPGKNEHPVSNARQHIPLDTWQKWASPVWMDIDQTNVLNGRQARDERDERHICPLQLDLIERALMMWSNPGDVVLSPFMGIGSEGVVSLRLGRKFVGVELKEQYWRQACGNLSAVEAEDADLFGRGVA